MNVKINHVKEYDGGYFQAETDSGEAGRMTYSQAGAGKIMIDHTEVRPKYSDQGIGAKMVAAAVDYARGHNLRIIPLCSFAKHIFSKNEDMRDVLYI